MKRYPSQARDGSELQKEALLDKPRHKRAARKQLVRMPQGRCRSLAHPSRTSKQQQYTRNGSASTRRPPPSSPRTHTTDRKHGSRNETQARSPAAHDAARHIDSQARSRLFSWHCPLSSALASATAPVSPMPFPGASQPHIQAAAVHPQRVSIDAPPTALQSAHAHHRPKAWQPQRKAGAKPSSA